MGQKVNPIGFRIGVIRDWDARWYASKNYTELLHEDLEVRKLIRKQLERASVSRIEIEQVANNLRINIHTAKPGMVIGRGGSGVERLRKLVEKLTMKKVHLNIIEIKVPELDAYLVAQNVASQLEKRIAFRRAMKQAVFRTLRQRAKELKYTAPAGWAVPIWPGAKVTTRGLFPCKLYGPISITDRWRPTPLTVASG